MLKVCLTGATGFIGSNLLAQLKTRDDLEIIALSRKLSPIIDGAKKGNITWRRCDGFSLIDVEAATKDADVLIYLIHSMLPSSSLTQGTFADFDLYLADNFAKAANTNGIKHIVYLSGLIPNSQDLSTHLKSRLEVENTLAQYNNKLTALRAGLIIGENGSSFKILERLSKRLPLSICPSWTLSKTQPIDLVDVLASIEHCLDNLDTLERHYDIAGPDIITYKEMLLSTAKVLNKKRYIINVPFFSPGFSKLWVSKVTSTPHNLVYPLVESLKHDMVANPKKQLILKNHPYRSFLESLENGLDKKDDGIVRTIINYNASINFRWLENVTSVQRIEVNTTKSGPELASQYFKFLPILLKPFVSTQFDNDTFEFLLFRKLKLLILKRSSERSDHTRSVFYVAGGMLARNSTLNGRLEFRTVESSRCLIVALLNYRPSLPWFIYKYSQAYLHLYVMNSFGKYLRKLK